MYGNDYECNLNINNRTKNNTLLLDHNTITNYAGTKSFATNNLTISVEDYVENLGKEKELEESRAKMIHIYMSCRSSYFDKHTKSDTIHIDKSIQQ